MVRAGEQAEHALAFERAAALYGAALQLSPSGQADAQALRVRMADALVSAGRGFEAALAYAQAAEGQDSADVLELLRRAAHQLVTFGHQPEGLLVLDKLLTSQQLCVPSTGLAAHAAQLKARVLRGARGLSFARLEKGQVPALSESRADLCVCASALLGMVDTRRGLTLSMLGVNQAQRTGDPYRVSRAVSVHSEYLSVRGASVQARVDTLLHAAETLAVEADSAHAQALVLAARGKARLFCGRFRAAVQGCAEAERLLREKCVAVQAELTSTRTFGLLALAWLGEYAEVNARLPALLEACQKRGDRHAEATLGAGVQSLAYLLSERVSEAQHALARAELGLSMERLELPQYFCRLARATLALHQGDSVRATELADQLRKDLGRSPLAHAQLCRVQVLELCGRAALLQARHTPERALGEADQLAQRLYRERVEWAIPQADLLLSAVAHARGHAQRARELGERALVGFEAVEMRLHAASTRLVLARLTDGDASRSLLDRARAYFELQRIAVERASELIAPGLRA